MSSGELAIRARRLYLLPSAGVVVDDADTGMDTGMDTGAAGVLAGVGAGAVTGERPTAGEKVPIASAGEGCAAGVTATDFSLVILATAALHLRNVRAGCGSGAAGDSGGAAGNGEKANWVLWTASGDGRWTVGNGRGALWDGWNGSGATGVGGRAGSVPRGVTAGARTRPRPGATGTAGASGAPAAAAKPRARKK